MIIIAGSLYVDAVAREDYLAAVSGVAASARRAPGCLDFVQAPDLIDPDRITIYERWESDADIERFRTSGGPDESVQLPEIRRADVRKYRIAAVEDP